MKQTTTVVLMCILSGCASTSGVMEAAENTYIISAGAAPVRGGVEGAYSLAYEEAQRFCAQKDSRAVIIAQQDRDVYSSAWSNGSGSIAANGKAKIRFKCER